MVTIVTLLKEPHNLRLRIYNHNTVCVEVRHTKNKNRKHVDALQIV